MPLELEYSRGTCVQKHKGLQLPHPIEITTPWLEIDDMRVGTFANQKIHWWLYESYFVVFFNPEKYPEFTSMMDSIDGPPRNAPEGTVKAYHRMNGRIVLKLEPYDFDLDMLKHYVFNCENQDLKSVKLNNREVHAGDKIKLKLSVKGYGRKCLRLYYKVEHFEIDK